MQPRESTHYNNLGTALHELGDLEAAEHAYRQGLLLEPDNAGALASLGSLRWQKGDAVETRDLMLAAWRLDPGMPEPRIYGASACLKCADPDMAAKLLEHCEKWPFLGATLEADLCAALIQIDRADEAERRLRSLMKHAEARSIASIRLAALMERVNRLDEAERLLAEASIAPADRSRGKPRSRRIGFKTWTLRQGNLPLSGVSIGHQQRESQCRHTLCLGKDLRPSWQDRGCS
jgi:tetratricopeptide (TPR) repeat protein